MRISDWSSDVCSSDLGYKQHAAYARLRAIETRRSVARSANTGISMLIDQRGDVLSKTTWWTSDAIAGEIKLNAEDTFYVKHGNFIALAASGAARTEARRVGKGCVSTFKSRW